MIKLLICSYYAALLNIIYYILANYLLLSISSKEIAPYFATKQLLHKHLIV